MKFDMDIDALSMRLQRVRERQRHFFSTQIEFRINLQLLIDAQEQLVMMNQKIRAVHDCLSDQCKARPSNPSGNSELQQLLLICAGWVCELQTGKNITSPVAVVRLRIFRLKFRIAASYSCRGMAHSGMF